MPASIPLNRSCSTAFRMQNNPLTTVVPETKKSGRTTTKPWLLDTQYVFNLSFQMARIDTISPISMRHCDQECCKRHTICLLVFDISHLLLSSCPDIFKSQVRASRWHCSTTHRFQVLKSKKLHESLFKKLFESNRISFDVSSFDVDWPSLVLSLDVNSSSKSTKLISFNSSVKLSGNFTFFGLGNIWNSESPDVFRLFIT